MERYSRREFILKLVGAIGALYLSSGCLYPKSEVRARRRIAEGGIEAPHPTPELTPNDEFYVTNFNGTPSIDIEGWSLVVDGLVERPLTLSYEEITSMTSVSEIVTLECIGNGIGGDLIGNAEWVGVPLKTLLDRAMVKPSAVDVVLYGEEGYSDSLSIEKAMEGDTILAYKMNGETLPKDHGYPLRAIVPGIYGMKNVKWLRRIEVVGQDYKGHWEKQGWSDSAVIKLMSRIDAPRDGDRISRSPYNVVGIAYGGLNGVSRVEVSTDGGRSWNEAKIKEPLSEYAWTLWSYPWNPTEEGRHKIMVRATDRDGNVQKKGSVISRRVYPSGADGMHSIDVYVEKT